MFSAQNYNNDKRIIFANLQCVVVPRVQNEMIFKVSEEFANLNYNELVMARNERVQTNALQCLRTAA